MLQPKHNDDGALIPVEDSDADPGQRDGPESTVSNLHSSSFSKGSEQLELIFRNLDYSVPLKKKRGATDGAKSKQILANITGIFRPGRLTAVMGSSGAGKTTLLSVLAGNTREGRIEGDILVNGEKYSGTMLKEISGFVFQDDVLLPTMTVREAISMSALLRTPKSVSKEEREERVNDIISILHLDKAQNTIVGSPLQKGISGGERKRTAIGMEVVVNPSMLFLDEPTTGLDTFTAFTVILSLARLAQLGKTVIATIHQPSTEIFNLFDDLLILSRGRVAYFGPTQDVVDYFARQGYPCPQYVNPPDYIFMQVLREFGSIEEGEEEEEEKEREREGEKEQNALSHADQKGPEQTMDPKTQSALPLQLPAPDAASPTTSFHSIGEGTAAGTGLFSDETSHHVSPIVNNKNPQKVCDQRIESLLATWSSSPENESITNETKNVAKKGVAPSALRKRAPFPTQFKFMFKRASLNFVRNRQLLISRFVQAIFLGLVLGLVFLNTNQHSVPVQIRNKAGALFFIAVNTFFAASTQILSIFGIEKPVFLREYQGGYYGVPAYYASKTLIEVPGQIIGPFLMVIICYYMIGLNPAFSAYLMVATLAALGALCGNAYGTLIVAMIDDLNVALTLAPLFILPLLVVSGIFVAALPVYLIWLKYISPIYYSYSGMLQTEFSRDFPNCSPDNEVCSGERAIDELNFADTFSPGVNLVFLITIFVTLWILGFIILSIAARKRSLS